MSGSEGSVFGGQSTPSPSAISVVPRPTSSFQRSAMPYGTLSCGTGRLAAEARRGDIIGEGIKFPGTKTSEIPDDQNPLPPFPPSKQREA